MGNSKIVVYGETYIDLTADTVTPESLAQGVTAHDKAGDQITGTSTKDVDSTDATAAEAEILAGKTAYARGTKLTGTMVNQGAVTGTIAEKDETYTIPQGFHDGSGSVAIDGDEQAKIIPTNIKSGVSILGVEGSYNGEQVTAQQKTVTPTKDSQTVLPDEGYDYLSQVVVQAVPIQQTQNSAGGYTVTIG